MTWDAPDRITAEQFQQMGGREWAPEPSTEQPSSRRRARPEEDFQRTVIALAEMLGWRVYHTRNSRGSVAGFPDLILLRGERGIAAELKVVGNKPTQAQLDWLLAFGCAGFEQRVWYPVDYVAIQEALR